MAIFEQGAALRVFFRGSQKIETWLAKNYKAVHKSSLSRALAGHDSNPELVGALDQLLDEVARDPWSFCEPPELDHITDYAGCRWWYDALEPAVMWSRFERIKQFPLTGNDREIVQASFDDWKARLKTACDRYQEDYDLVRSLQSDVDPKYQTWSKDPWRLDRNGTIKRRVGFQGLGGRSPEEVGRAFALDNHELPLPNIQKARLDYERPHSIPMDYDSELVEPWNGDEFEGVELAKAETGGKTWDVRHRVRFYWDGQRYQVEDVEPFAQIKAITDNDWRAPTQDERDLLEIGMVREYQSREEFIAGKDVWIDEVWADRIAEDSFQDKVQFPDGIPRSAIEDQYEVILARYEEGGHMAERALDEKREYNRRRVEFMRSLRRRP